MPELPPPSGPPVVDGVASDPWAEQSRRRARHRAEQRRRRARWSAACGLVLIAAVGVIGIVTFDDRDRPVGGAAVGAPADRPGTTTTPSSVVATGAGESRVTVADVWLLDQGGGEFVWGALLASDDDVVRTDLAVSAVVLDADGQVVIADQFSVPQLAPGTRAAVGGPFDPGATSPVRVEVTATTGTASPDVAGVVFDLSDVRRVLTGQVDRDDRLLGTAALTDGDAAAVRVTALWRDDDGRVVASASDVVTLAADDTAPFSLRLPRRLVPPGEPDTIVAGVAPAE